MSATFVAVVNDESHTSREMSATFFAVVTISHVYCVPPALPTVANVYPPFPIP